jgi:hypothetical protein
VVGAGSHYYYYYYYEHVGAKELALLGFAQILRVPVFCWDRCVERSEEIAKRHDGEWAAEKRNPTSEAHYDGTFPTTSRTTTNDNGIGQLTAAAHKRGTQVSPLPVRFLEVR